MKRLLQFCVLLCLVPGLRADLDKAKAEQNLEKRSHLALENADEALENAKAAYKAGDLAKTKLLLTEVQDSVTYAEQSLNDTGKNPRKSPKWFKKAEITTRNLLRKLNGFSEDMSYTDRSLVDPVRAKVQQVHEDLLLGIMEGKKKK